ncbi:FOG: EAL domain [Moorella thermoacetica Y72]|uniref:FOG: EAL domain n=1 Tax=Moorella thermoacetica Y72 TaxID=1325331 RepID=A0A0S6UAJ4_NEOTH|nr:FOG: EAL domain [Moorella thermoacetica Y72]
MPHFGGTNQLGPRDIEVRGPVALGQDPAYCRLNGCRRLVHFKGVLQHHGCRKDGRQGIGFLLAGNVRCRAVAGFIEGHGTADAGRGQHANGTRQDGSLITQDIAKGILGHNYVKLGRAAHQLHGAVVDIHVLHRYLGELAFDILHRIPPQARGGEDVGLVDAGQVAAPLAGYGKGQPDDAFNLRPCVIHGIIGHFPLGGLLSFLGAEVKPPRQFPDDNQVGAGDYFLLQGRGLHQGIIEKSRAQVGIEAQFFTQGQQGCRLRALCRGQGIPFRTAYRPQEHGIALAAEFQGLRRQGYPPGIDSSAAYQRFGKLEFNTHPAADCLQDLDGLGDDLRADTITGQNGDFIHWSSPSWPRRASIPRRQ